MNEALCIAAGWGEIKEVRRLIDGGAEVTAKFFKGRTALHRAAAEGHEGVVRILLDAGADVAAKAVDGKTALDIAEEHGHAGVARVLRDVGAAKAASAPVGMAEVPVGAKSAQAGAQNASIAAQSAAERRTEKTLDLAKTQKEKGDAEYEKLSYASAAEAYSKAIRLTEILKAPLPEQQAATRALKLTCLVHTLHLAQAIRTLRRGAPGLFPAPKVAGLYRTPSMST